MFKPTFFDDNDPNNPKRKTYIERKTLIKDIAETVVFTVKGGASLPTSEMRGANKVIDRIKSAPTADVVEVRHGEWNFVLFDECIICSECKNSWNVLDNCTETFNYCPNCGAKMDGKGG